ncbi:membrane protein insertase YidC [Marinobacterium sediminicola]|uniref:Membrane protein insertase YidC n=1 Tax=Marinobacterium sediminicola TaxID=518898 RepID=A0ABY1S4D8_9GAMM|nr:membrane protein insertase YidC [Marinobacterium sediminicola]ULG69231.1 membrane protein insertase YidC [Marinobacterium sediminicola]SMR78322.1 protein translocase subunit yidC [Marinobacterium sediminicola]
MDVQRVILIAALALVSYLMVLQWNEDYGPAQQQSQQQVTTVSAYSSNGTSQGTSELPQASGASASADIPVTDSSALAQAESGTLIHIRTDVLDLLVDPRGGDIIQAALPKHDAVLNSEQPFVLLEQNSNRTYVAQSGLIGQDGPDAAKSGRPLYSSKLTEYVMEGDSLTVDLNLTTEAGVQVTKRFNFTKGEYKVGVEFIVNNASVEPFDAVLFGQIKRDGSPDPSQQTSMGMQSYLGAVFSTTENNYQKVDFSDMDEERFKAKTQDGWVAMVQHYFLSAWIPAPGAEYTYESRKINGQYLVGFLSPDFSVAPGETQSVSASFYAGPKDVDQLEQIAPNLDLTIDYGWLWWIASPLYMLLKWIHSVVGNWGLAIIGITILVKAALFHLNAKAFKSMAKMRKFGPEMARLKELYGDDRQKMSQEMMKLYQKEKINPLGGCLPILVQMPVFIALYWVLMESVELRHAPFYGYIQDLSQMDPYFILPILMGVTMFIQQMLNPTPPDPMQAKMMKMLPIVFTFFFLWFPAGLVLYWLVNNILSIAQQWVINKQIEAGEVKD